MNNRRAVSYPGSGGPITVPSTVWTESLAELRRLGEHQSEGLVFWGGLVSGGELQVTGLYILAHEPQGARVKPTKAQMRWLLRTLSKRDEKLLAQVHSHPGRAFHSSGDDDWAASAHAGFLSIVVPRYGRRVSALHECAVYERRSDGFTELSEAGVRRRFRVTPSVVRRKSRSDDASSQEEQRWIPTIVSSLKRKLTGLKRRLPL